MRRINLRKYLNLFKLFFSSKFMRKKIISLNLVCPLLGLSNNTEMIIAILLKQFEIKETLIPKYQTTFENLVYGVFYLLISSKLSSNQNLQ